jgi:hypothetical protein
LWETQDKIFFPGKETKNYVGGAKHKNKEKIDERNGLVVQKNRRKVTSDFLGREHYLFVLFSKIKFFS